MVAAAALASLLAAAAPAAAATDAVCQQEALEEDAGLREIAGRRVGWQAAPRAVDPVAIRILALNDFHGQLEPGRRVGNRPVGSAGVLAAWLEGARAGREDRTYLVHAGDHVGASPPASALLQDEPSIAFLNLFANDRCRTLDLEPGRAAQELDGSSDVTDPWLHPLCNLVGTVGNHEFDEGRTELLRLLAGGNHASGPFLDDPWRGARFPTLAANVEDLATGRPVLPPYAIRRLGGVPVGFIGLVLKETPTIVTPSGVAGLRFLDEAETANRYARELVARGVRAIVVLIHQGGTQASYQGPTEAGRTLGADFAELVSRLDGEIDVVISGHRHAFSNALAPNAAGRPVLVTQAFSSGTAFGQVDLEIDRASRDVVAKSASIVTTWADVSPGTTPEPGALALQDSAMERVAPLVERVVGRTREAIGRTADADGEQPLGLLIADAQRAAMGADVAFMNPGGVRADLDAGDVTWGELFAVQPFGNSMVRMTLTGEQLRALLARQFEVGRVLQPSGLRWTYRGAGAARTVVDVTLEDGSPLLPEGRYAVAVNSFLADGGDGFTLLAGVTGRAGGPVDLDALEAYVAARSAVAPVEAPATDRVTRVP
jgi:5'-nucleotidase